MQIVYQFTSDSGTPGHFLVKLDPDTLNLQQAPLTAYPPWTRLEHARCEDCPLAATDVENCPMATALIDLLAFSRQLDSFSPLTVTVGMDERVVRSTVSAQRALSSLMGLLIATCACPEVAWLRPMARFHLPLASEDETIYRATSMYMLAQYFRQRAGFAPDLALAGLSARYQRLHQINLAMAERLRSAIERDASVNAVILLDLFAKAMPYSVNDSVAELEHLFRAYLE